MAQNKRQSKLSPEVDRQNYYISYIIENSRYQKQDTRVCYVAICKKTRYVELTQEGFQTYKTSSDNKLSNIRVKILTTAQFTKR